MWNQRLMGNYSLCCLASGLGEPGPASNPLCGAIEEGTPEYMVVCKICCTRNTKIYCVQYTFTYLNRRAVRRFIQPWHVQRLIVMLPLIAHTNSATCCSDGITLDTVMEAWRRHPVSNKAVWRTSSDLVTASDALIDHPVIIICVT